MDYIQHPFPPVYDKNSRILILGTFPSVKSRESQFFYGHPQNRFWKVLAHICRVDPLITIDEKKSFLLTRGIALWDVLESCHIELSMDSSIKDPIPNDFSKILEIGGIRAVFTNGKKAEALYHDLVYPVTGIPSICLPSTSPANGQFDFVRLIKAWQVIMDYDNLLS